MNATSRCTILRKQDTYIVKYLPVHLKLEIRLDLSNS